VVVVGGTGGVGRHVVRRCCAAGANVVFLGRDADAAASLVAECGPAEPVFFRGDLADPASLAALFDTAAERFGQIHGAVASGGPKGTAGFKPFREMAPEDLPAYFASGALPKLQVVLAATRAMAPHRYGKVVIVTTDAGRVPTPGESMIGAAAASLVFATRAVARELARDGIRLNTVGISLTTGTPAHERHAAAAARPDADAAMRTSVFTKLEQKMPFGLASAAEVAGYVAFLLGPESDGMTGATLSVNRGGYFPSY
jgi:3-oxoacyl-[acyl-carrier protein] reductase